MNSDIFKAITSQQLKSHYALQAEQALSAHSAKIRILLEQGRCPDIGWDESSVELFLQNIALMDSNNYLEGTQMGEREARFASDIVRRRHFRMGHGIGRSGDIKEQQPKAAGSTLMNSLTNSMLRHILQVSGIPSTSHCFVVPLATGMTLVLCILAFKSKKPNAKYILWPRIDQKSCFKCIKTAGYTPIVIGGCLVGDELRTDVKEITRIVEEVGAENILGILSTTSCFAPRSPDDIVTLSEVCAKYDLIHIVNNAYGVQSTKCMSRLEQAFKNGGRIDVYVQSTDKNFMVPVGGAVVAGFHGVTVERVAQTYAGRGSGSPTMDVFITLLTLGVKGYKDICKQRKNTFNYLAEKLEELAVNNEQRVLRVPSNDISIGITLNGFGNARIVTEIGSMLFTRFVFGTRTVAPNAETIIEGHQFVGWGSHCDHYPHNYLTAAVSVGTTIGDVDKFVEKLRKIFTKQRDLVESRVEVPENRASQVPSLELSSVAREG